MWRSAAACVLCIVFVSDWGSTVNATKKYTLIYLNRYHHFSPKKSNKTIGSPVLNKYIKYRMMNIFFAEHSRFRLKLILAIFCFGSCLWMITSGWTKPKWKQLSTIRFENGINNRINNICVNFVSLNPKRWLFLRYATKWFIFFYQKRVFFGSACAVGLLVPVDNVHEQMILSSIKLFDVNWYIHVGEMTQTARWKTNACHREWCVRQNVCCHAKMSKKGLPSYDGFEIE